MFVYSASYPVFLSLFFTIFNSFSPSGGVWLFPIISLAILVWMGVALCRAAASAWKRSWRTSFRKLLFVAFTLPIVVLTFRLGDYVHLAIMYSTYEPRIAASNGKDEIEFAWGGTGFLGAGNSIRTLVYSPKGLEIGGKPLAAEPAVWVITYHLLGHFYIQESNW